LAGSMDFIVCHLKKLERGSGIAGRLVLECSAGTGAITRGMQSQMSSRSSLR
jgi:hypothetical protein